MRLLLLGVGIGMGLSFIALWEDVKATRSSLV